MHLAHALFTCIAAHSVAISCGSLVFGGSTVAQIHLVHISRRIYRYQALHGIGLIEIAVTAPIHHRTTGKRRYHAGKMPTCGIAHDGDVFSIQIVFGRMRAQIANCRANILKRFRPVNIGHQAIFDAGNGISLRREFEYSRHGVFALVARNPSAAVHEHDKRERPLPFIRKPDIHHLTRILVGIRNIQKIARKLRRINFPKTPHTKPPCIHEKSEHQHARFLVYSSPLAVQTSYCRQKPEPQICS